MAQHHIQSDEPGRAHAAGSDLRALTEAFEHFSRTSAAMEESYRKLEARIQSLERELQEKNRQLTLMREEVRRKDRLAALGEMAATVAHEIRNPLGGIQGFAALLERDVPADDPRRRLVEKILAGTKSLDRVVNELLEYTRPVELRLERVDAKKLVDSAIGYLSGVPPTIEICNEIAAGIWLRADPHRLRQVLLNVLQNAVQSIEGAGRVEVSACADGAAATITIADTGAGIAKEHMEKVFMPFFTTREKGTGLGLAVASKLVESHGGTMDVSSAPGEGAAFRITLPRGDEE